MIKPETKLSDQEQEDFKVDDSVIEKEMKLASLWKKRFDKAESFRRPFIEKNLRMYKLYRAYRDAINYAYGTSLMPPTGFEIIETIKPRLASAQVAINIYPTKEEDVENESIQKWDDLLAYDLQVTEFEDKKIEWINAQLMYGNGTLQVMWEGDENGNPYIEIVDNFLFYPDPQAGKRLKDSRWEIKQTFKSKAVLEAEEIKRGDAFLYRTYEEENGVVIEKPLIKSTKWKEIEEENPTTDDPRRQRYEINTKKMGQINDNKIKGQATDAGPGSTTEDKYKDEPVLEIWECWDHVEGKLVSVVNRKWVIRNEDNPYSKILDGRVFIDLPDITLNWEYYAMSHLEPVETTIHEIADSRNQAMDNIVYNLDPIRKVKKGAGYKDEELVQKPGATWYVQKADDIMIERPPDISGMWVEKDTILRREVQTSLALSEYTQGIPQSSSEPASKVEMLLLQTNIRLGLVLRQLEIAMTEMVQSFVQMNQQFLGEEKSIRLVGKKLKWSKFTEQDKEMMVDAYVSIKPKKEKTAEQEAKEAFELYKLLVVDDKPEGGDERVVMTWNKKKAVLQRLIVEKMGYEELVDVLAPEEIVVPKKEEAPAEAGGMDIQGMPPGGMVGEINPQELKQGLPQPEAMLQPEGMAVQNQGGGMLQALLGRVMNR
jgi:hypothetical protein